MPSKLELLPPDILERLQDLPERVTCLEGLVALWLFGSFARGEATRISDVDLAFLPADLDRLEARLYRTIAATLGTDEFALVHLKQAPAHFAQQVLAEGRLLVCRDLSAVAEFAEATYRHAPDACWLHHTGNVDFLEGVGMPAPKIDRDRVTDFLRLISEDLRDLRAKAGISKVDYLKARDAQRIVERCFQTATEGCINIGNHLVARLGLRAPQDYADVFRILDEAQILPGELAEQMMDLARFRNLLVHVYWQIDHTKVYDGLPARLTTLEAFTQRIARWLKEHA